MSRQTVRNLIQQGLLPVVQLSPLGRRILRKKLDEMAADGSLGMLHRGPTTDGCLKALIPIVVSWKIENARSEETRKLIKLYRDKTPAFDELHGYRSKIESVFSAIKRTTGCYSRSRLTPADKVETRSDVQFVGTGRINEILARCIAHNLRQLVMLEHMHDDRVNFDADRAFEPLPNQREDDNPFDAAA